MKILFLTILPVNDIQEQNIYNDLMRTFRDFGHQVYIACPNERRYKQKTNLIADAGIQVLKVKTLNFQKTNIIEKGLSTILLEHQYYNAIKKYFNEIKFDLVLYSTPPITFTKVVRYIKNRDGAFSYLLLKDIFPQNAVDLGMLKDGGLLHRYFKKKEKKLYAVSDRIGCMSPANVKFVCAHNKELPAENVEVNPNTIIPRQSWMDEAQRQKIRAKYNIPSQASVFIYGGNLGKPQGVSFLLDVLKTNLENKQVFFLIVGSGTEFEKLKKWFDEVKPTNSLLIAGLPKLEYDEILQASDIGLIFLDKRFTIPNFPSRLLSYLECKMPILAATDVNTDIGCIANENGFGFWCESGAIAQFNTYVDTLTEQPLLAKKMGMNGFNYLNANYTSMVSYEIIMSNFKKEHAL